MCPRFPYPLEKGDKLRMYHQIRMLSKKHEIYLLALSEDDIPDHDLTHIRSIVDHIKIYRLRSTQKALSISKSLVSSLPFQVSLFFDKKIAVDIAQVAMDWQPDHIYCQLTRMSEYARSLEYPKTIDYMDAFGVGMSRRSETVGGLMSYIYRSEARRMSKYERDIYPYFDNHVAISKQDAALIHDQPISVVPNGIDTEYYSPQTKDKRYDIGFVGNMGYAPNIDAAEYLVKKVLPHVNQHLKVIIAGARPDKRVKQLASDTVTITGWMEDVRTAYAQSKIFVAPLWLGTGQQNKILEAMAMGIPCVTSEAVNNAIGADDGNEILVAHDEEGFAICINKLLSDTTFHKRMSVNGRTFVANNYSWERSVDKLEEILINTK